MKLNLTLNVGDAIADLDAINQSVLAQTQQIVSRAASKYERLVKASTPVGPPHKGRKPLSTGWVVRDKRDPARPHIAIANIRPHAHLAAEGFDHVGGKHVDPFVPWIKQAINVRAEMRDAIATVTDAGLPVVLRALEIAEGRDYYGYKVSR